MLSDSESDQPTDDSDFDGEDDKIYGRVVG